MARSGTGNDLAQSKVRKLSCQASSLKKPLLMRLFKLGLDNVRTRDIICGIIEKSRLLINYKIDYKLYVYRKSS